MSAFYQRSFFVLTAAVLGLAVWQILAPFWGALAWSIVLAVLLAPLQDRLLGRLGNRPRSPPRCSHCSRPWWCSCRSPCSARASSSRGARWSTASQHSNWRIDATLVDRIEDYPLVGPVVSQITDMLDLEAAEITGFVVSIGQTLLRYAANLGSQLVLGALNTTLAFMLMLFLLFFMLRDGRQLLQRVGNLDAGRHRRIVNSCSP
jgi:predicted PurR-regulated permease PerM